MLFNSAGRGRAIVLWSLGLFVALQVGFYVPLSHWWPQLHDPEYGGKLARLRARLAEAGHDRPLLLVLGSSHVGMGLNPGVLPNSHADAQQPVIFNFGINGGGLVVELLCLRRLLAEGIRPDCVLVEAWGMHLHLDGQSAAANGCLSEVRVQWRDLPVLGRYYAQPHKLRTVWRSLQWMPWFNHRNYLLSYFAPSLLHPKEYLGPFGKTQGFTEPYDKNPQRMLCVKAAFLDMFKGFQISTVADSALHDVLALCRREKIGVGILRMPESSLVRSWYPGELTGQLEGYFARLTNETGVPIIDARNWVPESGFSDGSHLNPAGSTIFTLRFQHEVIQPGLAGRLLN
jgi:hypothetical protein